MNQSFLPDIHRALPQNIEAEKGVLGSVLFAYSIRGREAGRDLMSKLESSVSSVFFHYPAHRIIWDAIKQLHADNDPLDFITLTEALTREGSIEQCGGPAYIAELFDFIASDANVDEYVSIIKEKHELRSIESVSRALAGAAYDSVADPKEVAERAIQSLSEIAAKSGVKRKSRLSVRRFLDLYAMEFDDLDNFFGDRIIAAGQPVTILGPGGVGKSRIVTQLAMCMIAGRDFLGMPTRGDGKRWLFIQSENSTRRLKKDVAAMVTGLSFQEEDQIKIHKNLFFHTIEKEEDTFLDLENESDFREISALIEDIKPDIVVFDPLNTFTSLELNADKDMKQVVQSISRVVKKGNPERIPVVIHHSLTGKAGAAKAVGWDKASYGRNSKVLQAWTRAQINISPVDPENPNRLVMACGKNNNGAMFPDVGVLFVEKGIYVTDPDFDPDAFRENVGLQKAGQNRKSAMSPAEVAALFEGQIDRKTLLKAIRSESGVSDQTAYRIISDALSAKAILRPRKTDYHNPIFTKPNTPTSHDTSHEK